MAAMRLRYAAAAGTLACVLVVPVAESYDKESRKGDLDGDAVVERARTVRVPSSKAGFDRTAVNVTDRCPSGREIDRRVAGPQDELESLKLIRVDTHPGREVLAELSSRKAGKVGEVSLVAWRPRASATCAKPRVLFRYRRATKRPKGARAVTAFSIGMKELKSRYPGIEIQLEERFARSGESFECATLRKWTYFRLDEQKDRYVSYKTRVRSGRSPAGC